MSGGDGGGVRTAAFVFGGVAAFVGAVAVAYGLLHGDPAGVVMLSGVAVLCGFVAAFLLRTPEPEAAAEVDDAPTFWPLLVGLAAAVTVTGLAFGPFAFVAGGVMLAAALLTPRGRSER